MHNPVIVCAGLVKWYRDTAALDGLDLEVPAGVVYGLLGPNGAGKTTLVRVLATLLRPDAGRAEVAGFDVVARPFQVQARIGVVGQQPALDEALSGRQNLELFGRLHHLGARGATRRADELLTRFGLADLGGKPVRQYSGGTRRRLDIAVAFIIAPTVLFLDEPTTGLDPHNRNQVWESVRELVAGGTTVLLTTQYLEEADQLAAEVSVLGSGRVIASGSPDRLKARLGGDRIDVVLRHVDDLGPAEALVRTRLGAEPVVDRDTRRISTPVREHVTALADLAHALREKDIAVEDLALRRPTLDEVFLHLTGAAA